MLNAERLYQMHISPPGGHPQNCKFSLFWLTESSWKRLLRDPWTARRSKQSWVFIARTDVEAETPVLWPPDAKSWLIWKDPDAGKDWRQEKEMTEDEMIGWHHQLNRHEKDRESWLAALHGVTKSPTRLNDWTTTKYTEVKFVWLT